jgi:CheY-like chemotaxis protein
MRYLIQTYLEEAGATVQSASNGADAVDTVREARARGRPFDAIVLDMQMPVMDGFQAAPRLRAAGHTGRIVALTANAMKGDQERCLAAGCDEYLAKSVDRLRLLYVLSLDGRSGASAVVGREESAGANGAPSGGGSSTPVAGVDASDGKPYRGRVLLVDDNADANEMLSVLLEGHGVDVTSARSGAEALERAVAIEPHVVVLNFGLPDVDGYTVLEHLRALEPMLRHALHRAHRSQRPRGSGADAPGGFHHQLVKPPDFEHLIELIKLGAT